jgi:tRNA threonylcarbamoyladenosine biosynthesis protein TsaB
MASEAAVVDGWALALETSGDVGGVAVGRGANVLDARQLDSGRRHAAELLPTIAALCREHRIQPMDLCNVYVSRGPGSFTGLRIGITVARMLALAGGAAVVGVPTMDAIAQNALAVSPPPKRLVVLVDARRGNVYGAGYHLAGEFYQADSEPAEVDPAVFLAGQTAETAVIGRGITDHLQAVKDSGLAILPNALHIPRVGMIYRLGHLRASAGRFDDAHRLVPTYIRMPSAEEVWQRKHGEA